MANVLIRDLPDEVHTALQHRAQQRHQSLQQYLTAELRELATRESVGDVLDAIESHQDGRVGLGQAAEDLASERP